MERVIAIVTEDAAYGHTLSEYMAGSHILSYRIIPFYDMELYTDYRLENDVYAVLIDEELAEIVSREKEEYLLKLTDERREDAGCVFKYQSLDVIVKEVNYKLHNKSTKGLENNYKFKTIAVTSAKGGSGVSSLSLVLAAVKSKERSTLFLSLDPTFILPDGLEKDSHAISELVYALRLYGPLWTEYAEGFIKHNKDFDYITGALCYEDVLAFGREEARNFFAGLSNSGRYQALIIDAGMLTSGSFVFFEKCERLFVLGGSEVPENKELVNQFTRLLGDEISRKIELVELPFDKKFQEGKLGYSDYLDTEMYECAVGLLKEKKIEVLEVNVSDREELSLPKVYTPPKAEVSKGRLRRLMEKGFSEGFNG